MQCWSNHDTCNGVKAFFPCRFNLLTEACEILYTSKESGRVVKGCDKQVETQPGRDATSSALQRRTGGDAAAAQRDRRPADIKPVLEDINKPNETSSALNSSAAAQAPAADEPEPEPEQAKARATTSQQEQQQLSALQDSTEKPFEQSFPPSATTSRSEDVRTPPQAGQQQRAPAPAPLTIPPAPGADNIDANPSEEQLNGPQYAETEASEFSSCPCNAGLIAQVCCSNITYRNKCYAGRFHRRSARTYLVAWMISEFQSKRRSRCYYLYVQML